MYATDRLARTHLTSQSSVLHCSPQMSKSAATKETSGQVTSVNNRVGLGLKARRTFMKSFIKQIQRKFNQQSIPKTGFLHFYLLLT